jgi:hypothetical protein
MNTLQNPTVRHITLNDVAMAIFKRLGRSIEWQEQRDG